jgi:translin
MHKVNNLESIVDGIRAAFEIKNDARDDALARSRVLTRHCANTIRAIHRQEWDAAQTGLQTVQVAGQELLDGVEDYPDLVFSGYTQDALKELVEAFVTYALVRGEPLPTPGELNVPDAAYLNGMAEAASELRRTILDIIRHGHTDEAERLLDDMDAIYNALMAFDFPDAITGGLRRRVDSLRGVLERTRGDLTNSLRQQRLREALISLEKRLGLELDARDD